MIEEETKMYILIRTKHPNKWSKSEELRLKLLRKKNNACNKKKYFKVNVNAPRRKTRPLSWLENQQLSASDQILSWDLSPPTRDEQ